MMNTIIKLEELAMFAFSIFLFSLLDFAWWWFPLLLFVPDLSMIGYAVSPKTGAWTYNLVHHKAVGIAVYVFGCLVGESCADVGRGDFVLAIPAWTEFLDTA